MTKYVSAVLAGLALCITVSIAAAAQEQPEYGKKPERTITANPDENHPVKGIDETDKNFLQQAAMGDEAEIQLGQLAQQKSENPAVKSFSERMIKDHSNNDDLVKNIAKSQHLSLPNALSPKYKDEADGLERLSGKQFDQAYMAYMVQEHTKDVNKFKQEADNAHDVTIKQFAQQSLPVLQSHLTEAQQVEQQVKNQ